MQKGQQKQKQPEGGKDLGAQAASDPLSFPSRQDFLRLRPEEQAAILTQVVSGNWIDLFIRYLPVVDVFEICRGKPLSETFFAAIKGNEDFLDQCTRTLTSKEITVEDFQEIIEKNLEGSFEDFLRALETNKSKQPISVDPPDSVSSNTLTIMLGMQARRNPWQCLYQQNLSALSWMQLGWRMTVDRNPDSKYEGIAFIHDDTRRIVVVDEQTNPAGLAAQSFVTSLVGSYKGYTFIRTGENAACLAAAKIAYAKGQQVFLFEQELAFLETLTLTDFDFRMTNIETDRECSIEAWFSKVRKNIIYLPKDFPINVLCSAVDTQWSVAKDKISQGLAICSFDTLRKFKTEDGVNVQAYFDSIAYTGEPEQFLLIITPDETQDPEFCKLLLGYPWSIIILAHDSEKLRTLNSDLPELQQYAFYRYCDRTARALIGGELITPEESLEPDEELTQASVEQQSLEAMIMSRFLRKKTIDKLTSLIQLANAVIDNIGLTDTVGLLERIAYQNVLKASYGLDLSSLRPDALSVLQASGLLTFNNESHHHEFISHTLYYVLASRHALKHLDEVLPLIPSRDFCTRLFPFLYSQAKEKEDKNLRSIETLLLRDDLPADVKARCYEFFPELYEPSIIVNFFIYHPEYRRYFPFALLGEYDEWRGIFYSRQSSSDAAASATASASASAAEGAAATQARNGGSSASAQYYGPKFYRDHFRKRLPKNDPVLDTTDVRLYLDAQIEKDFGGYRKIPGDPRDTYFLQNEQKENGVRYLVAVLPNAETSAALPGVTVIRVDHYLNATQHEEPLFLRCLRVLGRDDRFTQLKKPTREFYQSLHSVLQPLPPTEDSINVLMHEIIECEDVEALEAKKQKLKLEADRLCQNIRRMLQSSLGRETSLDTGILRALLSKIEECQDLAKFEAEIQKVAAKEAPVDVFTELKNYTDFFDLPATEASAAKWHVPDDLKILFPFNLGNAHWVSVEIKIHKEVDKYGCSTYLHDPLNPTNCLEEKYFELIKSALQKRLKDYDSDVTVVNEKSPYVVQRQHDSVNCGLYTVLDILERIRGEQLLPYTKAGRELSGHELRVQMIEDLKTAAEAALRAGNADAAKVLQDCIETNQTRMEKFFSQSGKGVTLGAKGW